MLFYQYINVFLRREDLDRIKKYKDNKNTKRSTQSIHFAPILDHLILTPLFASFMHPEGLRNN